MTIYPVLVAASAFLFCCCCRFLCSADDLVTAVRMSAVSAPVTGLFAGSVAATGAFDAPDLLLPPLTAGQPVKKGKNLPKSYNPPVPARYMPSLAASQPVKKVKNLTKSYNPPVPARYMPPLTAAQSVKKVKNLPKS